MAYGYKIFFPDGEEEVSEDVFDTEKDAEEAAQYDCSCFVQGGEVLELAGEDFIEGSCDYEVFEV